MTKSIHIAVLITLLGVLVLLITPHFLPLRPQATLTIISASLENINELQATMDVQHVFTYGPCQAWRGFLDGHLITVGTMGTDTQKAEMCTDWLLRKFSTRLVLITEESTGNMSPSIHPTLYDPQASNTSQSEALNRTKLSKDSTPSENNPQSLPHSEVVIRREATRDINFSLINTNFFAHRLNHKIQQPLNTLVARIAGSNNIPWIIAPISKNTSQTDPLLALTRKMLKHYDMSPTLTPTLHKSIATESQQ